MAWRQLTLRINADKLATAEALLELAGASALSLRDAADNPVLEPEPGATPAWPFAALQALFAEDRDLDAIAAMLRSALGEDSDIELASLADDDWLPGWRQRVSARRFGARLELIPGADELGDPAAAAVRLHMGLAFGTGEHPTTALCLEWLDKNVRGGERVLDYGCGSGVLALAALALGAHYAWAVDNDPQAVEAAVDNANLNGAKSIWIGAPGELPALEADIVAANILAGPLAALAPQLAAVTPAGGRIVLSGVLEWQRTQVQQAYQPFYADFRCASRDGWIRLEGRRRPTHP